MYYFLCHNYDGFVYLIRGPIAVSFYDWNAIEPRKLRNILKVSGQCLCEKSYGLFTRKISCNVHGSVAFQSKRNSVIGPQ